VTSFGKRLAPAAASAALMPQSFPARLVLPDGAERNCTVSAIDPDSALFHGMAPLPEGTPVVAFIEEIGRIDGRAGERDSDGGLWLSFGLRGARRARFIRHLRWLVRREQGLAAAERRHTRYEPRQASARIVLAGGREQPCEVLDISLSGAGLRARVRPSIGSPVTLGRMKGRVVRFFEGGFAIEFLTPLERSDLDSALR